VVCKRERVADIRHGFRRRDAARTNRRRFITIESLTTAAAADLLGMSSSFLTRLCEKGRVPSHAVGNVLHIAVDDVTVIQRERARLKAEARETRATAEHRRRARAAAAAGIE
jgi:excisionase family DNA binding protein